MIDITSKEINKFSIFTYWTGSENKGVYTRKGQSQYIAKYDTKCEEIINNPEKGLDVLSYYEITANDSSGTDIVERSSEYHQSINYCAFDENGTFDEMFDISHIDDGNIQTNPKDGFIEFINTITFKYKDRIPMLKVVNNKIQDKKGFYDTLFSISK